MPNLSDLRDKTVYNRRLAQANATRTTPSPNSEYNAQQAALLNQGKAVYSNASKGQGSSFNTSTGVVSSIPSSQGGEINQSAMKRLIDAGFTPEQAAKQIAAQQPGIRSTLSNSGLGLSYDSNGIAIPKTAGGVNDKSAAALAAKNAARQAELAGAKGYVKQVDEKGNESYIVDANATAKAQQDLKNRHAQEDALAAANIQAGTANMNANKETTGSVAQATPAATDPTSTPEYQAVAKGLSPEGQTQLKNLLTNYSANQPSPAIATPTAEQLDPTGSVATAQAKVDATSASQTALSMKAEANSVANQQRLDAEASAAKSQAETETKLANDKAQGEFQQAIRDQLASNEQRRQQLWMNSKLSGGFRNSMASASYIRALQAGENKLADLRTNQAFSGEFYTNKLTDIATTYHNSIMNDAAAYQTASLQNQQIALQEAKDANATILSTAKDQVAANKAVLEKYADREYDLKKNLADKTYDATKFVTTEARLASAETRNQINQIQDQELAFADKYRPGDNLAGWNMIQNRKRELGLATYPQVPTRQQLENDRKANTDNAGATIIGKYKSADGADYGLAAFNAVKAPVFTDSERSNEISAFETLMAQGKTHEAINQIILNAYSGLGSTERADVYQTNRFSTEAGRVQSYMNDFDPNYGGVWKKFEESLKPWDATGLLQRDEQFIALRQQIEAFQADIIHSKYGAALTKTELERANSYLVDFSVDNAKAINIKLAKMIGYSQRTKADRYDTILGPGVYDQVTQGDQYYGPTQPFNFPPTQGGTSFLDTLAEAHQQHEGFYEGSRSQRNNNPGNLKYIGQAGATGADAGNFAVFPDYQAGYLALKNDLAAKVTGKSKNINYANNPTLLDYVKAYAPAADSNDPNSYAQVLVRSLRSKGYNVDINTSLQDLAKLIS